MVPGAGVGQAGLWGWLVWGRSVGFEGGEIGGFFLLGLWFGTCCCGWNAGECGRFYCGFIWL